VQRPIALSDSEMTAVLNAARPIHINDRDKFLEAVAAALGEGENGPGRVFRVVRELQARFLQPPDVGGPHSKYAR
jgi:hypothetical protein